MRLRITGGKKLHAALAAEMAASKRAEQALFQGAEEIFNESQRQVPVRDAILKGSGNTKHTPGLSVISYGGAAKAYAIVQHERLDYKHPKQGKAKYLEDPMTEMGLDVINDIKKALKIS